MSENHFVIGNSTIRHGRIIRLNREQLEALPKQLWDAAQSNNKQKIKAKGVPLYAQRVVAQRENHRIAFKLGKTGRENQRNAPGPRVLVDHDASFSSSSNARGASRAITTKSL